MIWAGSLSASMTITLFWIHIQKRYGDFSKFCRCWKQEFLSFWYFHNNYAEAVGSVTRLKCEAMCLTEEVFVIVDELAPQNSPICVQIVTQCLVLNLPVIGAVVMTDTSLKFVFSDEKCVEKLQSKC